MPRWVKVFVIVAVAVGVAFAVSLLAGVEHGPGRHAPSDDHAPMQHGP